jgi:hypothetical protein
MQDEKSSAGAPFQTKMPAKARQCWTLSSPNRESAQLAR